MFVRPDTRHVPILWRPLVEEGCLITVAPYMTKYKGGVSPRDAIALSLVASALSRCSSGNIQVTVSESLPPKDKIERNIVFIASPTVNVPTAEVIELLCKDDIPPTPSLFIWAGCLYDESRDIHRLPPRAIPSSEGKSGAQAVRYVKDDIGLITYSTSPYDRSKIALIVQGVHGYGTLAAAMAFASKKMQEDIEEKLKKELGIEIDDANETRIPRDMLIEVLLHTKVAHSPGELGKTIRSIEKLTLELVRVNGNPQRQWTREPISFRWTSRFPPPHTDASLQTSQLIWAKKHPAPCTSPQTGQLRVYFDQPTQDERVRTLVTLQANISHIQYVTLLFSERDYAEHGRQTRTALSDPKTWQQPIKTIGEKLGERLAQVHAIAAQAMGGGDRQELFWNFAGPAGYLRIPFEFIRWSGSDKPLCLQYPVTRSISGLISSNKPLNHEIFDTLHLDAGKKLRLLLIASNPEGDLDGVKTEISEIEEILAPFSHILKVDALYPEHTTPAKVSNALERGQYHMLHFAGHSHWEEDAPNRSYLLIGIPGNPKELYIDRLSSLIEHKEVRFFYLSACKGICAGSDYLILKYDFLGLADALVGSGIPSVLGFRNEVDDNSAKIIAKQFYRELFKMPQFSLPRALFSARKEMQAKAPDDPSYLAPILIMQE